MTFKVYGNKQLVQSDSQPYTHSVRVHFLRVIYQEIMNQAREVFTLIAPDEGGDREEGGAAAIGATRGKASCRLVWLKCSLACIGVLALIVHLAFQSIKEFIDSAQFWSVFNHTVSAYMTMDIAKESEIAKALIHVRNDSAAIPDSS